VKRDPALVSLSHDHHHALFLAQALRRAEETTVSSTRRAVLDFWRDHGREHFRVEEEILFPAFAGHGDPHDPLLARALCEHAVIRHWIDTLTDDAARPLRPERLHELGELLAAHVRLEERELFPLIEATLPAPVLAALGERLDTHR
jgi:hemerythrin-like domain-containing protein